jgi:hypothetical protein
MTGYYDLNYCKNSIQNIFNIIHLFQNIYFNYILI